MARDPWDVAKARGARYAVRKAEHLLRRVPDRCWQAFMATDCLQLTRAVEPVRAACRQAERWLHAAENAAYGLGGGELLPGRDDLPGAQMAASWCAGSATQVRTACRTYSRGREAGGALSEARGRLVGVCENVERAGERVAALRRFADRTWPATGIQQAQFDGSKAARRLAER